METRASPLVRYLLVAYVLLIAYASLHPFSGWRDQGLSPFAFLAAPLPRYITTFDIVANALAYMPLGFLAVLALQPWRGSVSAVALATFGAALLSTGMEALQLYLPDRISSNLDVLTNTLGALGGSVAGAILAPRVLASGGLAGVRDRAFLAGRRVDLGLVILGLWLMTQLNPETLLFGTGDLRELLGATPAALHPAHTFIRVEGVVAAANLIAAALLGALLVAPGASARRVVVILVGAALLVRTAAFALLIRPEDAFAWATPGALAGLAVGILLALVSVSLSRGTAVALAGLLLMAATALVNVAPPNPYLANSLALWRQGHFLNFNGLTRLVSVLWPFGTLVYLMLWTGRRPGAPGK